jgi:hypothetical protein
MSFQTSVLSISIVVLIFFLIVISLSLYKSKSNSVFPPVVAQCPDYWTAKTNASGKTICENTQNLGNGTKCPLIKNTASKIATIDLEQPSWTSLTGNCNKSKWAKSCDLTWDGITNNNDACVVLPTSQKL